MPWIALDCGLSEHPKFLELPNDSARLGWVLTLLAAKRQSQPGRFRSERHYRGVLNRYAKYLPNYRALGLLETDEDGALVVHHWQRYQWKVAKERQRADKDETVIGQKEDRKRTSRARNVVPVPVDVLEEGVQGEPKGLSTDEAAVFAFLAQHGAAIREDSGYGRRLLGLMERRTPARVLETAWDMAQDGEKRSDRQWTFSLEARLEPAEDGREAATKERAAEVERQSQRGFDDTQRYLRELRGEA